MLATFATAYSLWCGPGRPTTKIAEKAAAEFETKNLLGVVLNGVEKSDAYGSYYSATPRRTNRQLKKIVLTSRRFAEANCLLI